MKPKHLLLTVLLLITLITHSAADGIFGGVFIEGGVTTVTGTSPISSSGGTTPVISIQDAAADGETKGAATFNATNFSAGAGVVNTIQGISTAATPTFAGVTTSEVLGTELTPALTTPNWTIGTGWQYLTTPNTIDKGADGTGTVTPAASIGIEALEWYKVIIVVASISGSTAIYTLGNTSSGLVLSEATTYTEYIPATNTDNLVITPTDTALRMNISSISIKKLFSSGSITVDGGVFAKDYIAVGGRESDQANAFFGDFLNMGVLILSTTKGGINDWYLVSNCNNTDLGMPANSFNILDNNTAVALTVKSNNTVQIPAYGAGTATFDADGNISSVSDERLKDIQGGFTAGMAELQNINPILYKYNEKSGMDTANIYAGFSAQNLRDYIPEAVGKNADGYYTVIDRTVLAALVNAVKDLQGQVNELKTVLKLPVKETTVSVTTDNNRIVCKDSIRNKSIATVAAEKAEIKRIAAEKDAAAKIEEIK